LFVLQYTSINTKHCFLTSAGRHLLLADTCYHPEQVKMFGRTHAQRDTVHQKFSICTGQAQQNCRNTSLKQASLSVTVM